MKHNSNNSNKFNSNIGNFANDAQAVKESELLPIYDGMRFSGDIQPLEDVIIPNYEKNTASDDKGEGQKAETKKKKKSIISNLDKKHKKAIIAVASSVAAIALIVTAVVLFVINAANESPLQAVYTTQGVHEILLTNGKTYSISDVDDVKVADGGMTLYYSVSNDSKTGTFDLKVIDVSKKSELSKGGTYINNSVNEGWKINADGSLMCYSKTEDGKTDIYVYSKSDGKSVLVSENAENFFLPQTGDVIYFTRKIKGVETLCRMRYGEQATDVANKVTNVSFYQSEEGFEILYAIETGVETTVDVYSVKDLEAPKMICENASGVNLDAYEISGNLYYFTKDTAAIDWRDVIDDPYFDNDSKMKEPVESDYIETSFFGLFPYVDRNAYYAAQEAYEAKAFRDKIREELDNINLGLAVENSYTCHIYTNGRTKTLTSGVQLENILAFSSQAAPRFIFAKSMIQVDKKIEMDTLIDFAEDENVARAIDYVMETVGESDGLSNECVYVWYDSTRVISYTIDEYEVEKTTFVPGTKDYLYAVSNGELYYNQVTSKEIMPRQLIDEGVVKAEFVNGYLYYSKENSYGETSIYRYSPETGKKHLADNLYDYFVLEKEYVILLSKQDADTDLMDIAVFKDGTYTEIDKDVSFNNFVYNGKSISYIKNSGNYENYDSGDMYIYTPEDGSEKIKEDVTKIFYVSKS